MKRNIQNSIFLGCTLAALFALTLASQAWAGSDTVLYNFGTIASDSENSYSSLVADKYGNLYGTASQGGAFGLGTVFVLCAPGATVPAPCNGFKDWQEVVLHSFKGMPSDGANPYGTLIFGIKDAGRALTIYGTTYNGGNDSCQPSGCGTVFQLCAPAAYGGCGGADWEESVVWQFAGNKDGAHPFAGVIEDKDNNLYGTTVYGGGAGVCKVSSVNVFCGTAFKLKQTGWVFSETVMHSFAGGSDGANPYGALCCNTPGKLITYLRGTTLNGGTPDDGTIFRIKNTSLFPETILWTFCSNPGCPDGAHPYANVIIDSIGDVYGTTYAGGAVGAGTIFKLATLPSPLYSFGGAPDGALPTAGLTLDSAGKNLYGTTLNGGSGACRCGTVFQFPLPNGPEVVNYSFTGGLTDGVNPWGGVIFDPAVSSSLLYGTTIGAGEFASGIAYSQ